MLHEITPVILTYNEAPNIGRSLERLSWARDIVVVDSLSTDETVTIAKRHPQVRVFTRRFDVLANQWNFALEQTAIATDWVLALDADYILTPGLVEELKTLVPAEEVGGFRTEFDYCIYGKALRGSTYGPVITLFRRRGAHVEQDGHAQRVCVAGGVQMLHGRIRHDDRKSIAAWCAAQNRYMAQEAEKLTRSAPGALSFADRLRLKIFFAPLVMLVYCAFVKGNILDGRAGFFYICQRTLAELLLSLHLLEQRLARASRAGSDGNPN